MSDFDKEAERERLREKYERDQEKRQATERMSDLLLKGATMTDAHCGDCGDPIFRYEGDEFCPTCQRVVDTDGSEADESADAAGELDADTAGEPDADTAGELDADGVDADDDTPTPGHAETKQPTGPTAGDPGADGEAEPTGGTREAASERPVGRQPVDAGSGSNPDVAPDTDPASASRPGRARSTDDRPRSTEGSDDPLGDARASLTRALLTHARRAEGTDDPRRARDHLAAAREAAEALAALY